MKIRLVWPNLNVLVLTYSYRRSWREVCLLSIQHLIALLYEFFPIYDSWTPSLACLLLVWERRNSRSQFLILNYSTIAKEHNLIELLASCLELIAMLLFSIILCYCACSFVFTSLYLDVIPSIYIACVRKQTLVISV